MKIDKNFYYIVSMSFEYSMLLFFIKKKYRICYLINKNIKSKKYIL